MLPIHKLLPRGQGLAPVLVRRAAVLSLDWAARQQPPAEVVDEQGRAWRLALPSEQSLDDGDVLVAEDGTLLRVQAAAQPVLQVRMASDHGSPADLLRAAHWLGEQHQPIHAEGDALTLLPNDEIAAQLRAWHLQVQPVQQPFAPRPLVPSKHAHGHHHHDHHEHHAGCSHDHGTHVAAPAVRGRPVGVAVSAAPAPHVHGPGCGHHHGEH